MRAASLAVGPSPPCPALSSPDSSTPSGEPSAICGAATVRSSTLACSPFELTVGATTKRTQREVDKLITTFEQLGRLPHPSQQTRAKAGIALRAIKAAGREIGRSAFVDDVLIALIARNIGATLVTRDATDHAFIAKLVDFSYVAVT
jgi:predicted nucleic acid-binding protein